MKRAIKYVLSVNMTPFIVGVVGWLFYVMYTLIKLNQKQTTSIAWSVGGTTLVLLFMFIVAEANRKYFLEYCRIRNRQYFNLIGFVTRNLGQGEDVLHIFNTHSEEMSNFHDEFIHVLSRSEVEKIKNG